MEPAGGGAGVGHDKEKEKPLRIHVHVKDKSVAVWCGPGRQQVRWLAHVGIARYDGETSMGWIKLGGPREVRRADGAPLDMAATIRDCLAHDDHVYVIVTGDS